MIDLPLALLVFAILTFAGFVKGVIGLGLPTVAIGLMSLAMPPAQAAALLVVPALATNVWQMMYGGQLLALARRLWPLLLALTVATLASVGQLAHDATGRAATILGLAIALYALVGLARIRLRVPRKAEPLLSPVIGAITGLIGGATGAFPFPSVPYLQALELERDALVQALGIIFMTATIALTLVLVHDGVFRPQVAGASALALLPALAGMAIGQRVRRRLAGEAFRRWLLLGLLALGAHLAARGLL
ncbi:MAG: sulfite exporter TauE/SafE family protein [Alphaproteobacteria bacterium]